MREPVESPALVAGAGALPGVPVGPVGGARSERPVRERQGASRWLMGAALAVALAGQLTWFWMERDTVAPLAAPPLTFDTVHGERITLQSLRGRVVLVSFWRQDCPACDAQLELLARLQRRFRPSDLAAIVVTPPNLATAQARQFAEAWALPFPAVVDPGGHVARQLRVDGEGAQMLVVDRDGMIVRQLGGGVPVVRIEGLISEVLADG